MSDPSVYRDYVSSDSFMSRYLAYQERYSKNIRESDRVLLELVAKAVARRSDAVVADIGCSTGNFLRHLRRAMPKLNIVGGELSEASLEVCRADEELRGVRLERMDIVHLEQVQEFDVAVVNAVLYMLNEDEFVSAVRGLGRALRPGGELLVFDFFHEYPQDLAIRERSASHPEGLMLHFRPVEKVVPLLHEAGFTESRFEPFRIPLDLEPGQSTEGADKGFQELNSYTVRAESGERLLFRGTLYQPWCHLVARKA